MNVDDMGRESRFPNQLTLILALVVAALGLTVATSGLYFFGSVHPPAGVIIAEGALKSGPASDLWQAPDSTLIPRAQEGELITYGHDLIAHTAVYLGPEGKVKPISNGMNCQNCHPRAGTKLFGNDFAAVASMYPRFRARSGAMESMENRINDCLERSLNGKPLEDDSREMRAMIAWFVWLGQDVQKGVTPNGTAVANLPLLDRAADPVKGAAVYEKFCRVCHGLQGVGYKLPGKTEWTYPPLAGDHSYNTAAGLYRLSRFAGYVKANMPYGTDYNNPLLSDEEAWDVAAYVNSLPRPQRKFQADWPDISKKPFDHPFGPYADTFTERQHKYGPFAPIRKISSK
jgi:thiosulfate dehydrogenase